MQGRHATCASENLNGGRWKTLPDASTHCEEAQFNIRLNYMQTALLSTSTPSYGVIPETPRTAAANAAGFGAPPRFRLYKRRWLMLVLFSIHALCNNMVCYTFAPVSDLADEYYSSDSYSFPLDLLITIFFITYVVLAFPASRFVERNGLRSGVLLGAWLQAGGAMIRAMDLLGNTVHSSPSDMVILGQFVASLGQSFFVIPPPLLAATWFAEDERTLATTIACNADALGIAVAYMVSPWVVTQVNHIPYLLQIIAIVSLGAAICSTLLFEDAPPLPPSYTALVRTLEKERTTTVTRILSHQRAHSRSIRRQITLSRFQLIDSYVENPDLSTPDSAASSTAPEAESSSALSPNAAVVTIPESSASASSDETLSTPQSLKSGKSSRRKSSSHSPTAISTDAPTIAVGDSMTPISSDAIANEQSLSVGLLMNHDDDAGVGYFTAGDMCTPSKSAPSSSSSSGKYFTIPSAVEEPPERLPPPVLPARPPRVAGSSQQEFGTRADTPVDERRRAIMSATTPQLLPASQSMSLPQLITSSAANSPRDSHHHHHRSSGKHHRHHGHHHHEDDGLSSSSDESGSDDDADHHELMAPPVAEDADYASNGAGSCIGGNLVMFREPGFLHAALAFAIGEATLNGFSTFMNSMFVPGGFSGAYVSWMGTLFVVSALVGSQIASTLVDKYKWYKPMIVLAFAGSVGSIVIFNMLANLPNPSENFFWPVTISCLVVGFFVGPLQPIAIEVATECTHPAPEAASTAILQVLANLLSTGLIPLMLLLKDPKTSNMSKANWVLVSIVGACGAYYLTFNGSYKRLAADQDYEERRSGANRNSSAQQVEIPTA